MSNKGPPENRRECKSIEDGGENEVPITPSVVFGILADKRDRFILYLLEERGGTIALDELSTKVAAWENDSQPELITKEMEHRVHQRLHHASIPSWQNTAL